MKQNNWFDPFYIQENLTEEETQIQKNVRDFCNKELRPNVVSNKGINKIVSISIAPKTRASDISTSELGANFPQSVFAGVI